MPGAFISFVCCHYLGLNHAYSGAHFFRFIYHRRAIPSERVQRQIDAFLDNAEAALRESEWQRAFEICRAVLNLDGDNEDARAYLGAAEDALGANPSIESPPEPTHTELSATEAESDTPTSFVDGRYQVTGFLGEGGKKKVYQVHDVTLDRDMAFAIIKADDLDDEARQRVLREAQTMGRLGDNPNIMPIFDLGDENGQPYMVQPLMGGGDVEALIENAEDGKLPLEEAVRIASEICRGLEYAHAKGIIHRDLKPGNIWLSDPSSGTGPPMIRIGDFGLALSLDRSRITQEKMMVGTVSYMPPEQATGGEITLKVDLYSLGAMLYEMVTGHPPFQGDDDIAIIGQHINIPPVEPQWHTPELPAQLNSLIVRLISKNPADRPESASEVLAALDAIDMSARPVADDEEGGGAAASGNLDSMAGGVFVGRQREMDLLKAKLENTLSGRGGMVTLVGEPGIGKTATSEELRTYAGLRQVQVLFGRCYEESGAPPYWPWIQALRSYVTSQTPENLREQMGSTASVIAEIVDEVKEKLPDTVAPPTLEDPESARFRLFDSIATFLRNASNEKPILLILDDLHWADRQSLLLLEFVARELSSSRVLLLTTYRDVDLGRRHPLSVTLGELTRERLFERVMLRGLTRADVGRFMEIAAGIKPPPGLIDAVHGQTEGNPLFVTETVRYLIQEGQLKGDGLASRDSWEVRIPEGVREVIGRRLDKLSERCNEVLTVASVIGREFTLDLLEAVVEDLNVDRLLDVLDEALAGRLITEDRAVAGQYQFTHAVIQETLRDELSATRRVRLHARIAPMSEKQYGDAADANAAVLAIHFAAAETVLGTDKLVHYSILAGHSASAAFAWQEAVDHYETAINAIAASSDSPADMTDETAQVLMQLSLAQSALLKKDESIATARKVLDHFIAHGRLSEAIDFITLPQLADPELVRTALELSLTNSHEAGKLLAWHGLFISIEGDEDKADEAFDSAAAIAQREGDTHLELRTWINSTVVALLGLRLDMADLRKTLRIIELAQTVEDRFAEAQAESNAAWIALCIGELQAAREHSAQMRILSEELRVPALRKEYLWIASLIAMATGDYSEATALSQQGLEFSGDARGFTGHLIHASQLTGDVETATSLLDSLRRKSSQSGTMDGADLKARSVLLQSLVNASRNGGDSSVIEEATEIANEIRSSHTTPVHQMFAYAGLAVLGADSGNTDGLEALIDSMSPARSIYISPTHYIGRVMGLANAALGKIDEAEKLFAESIEFSRTAGYQPELAWSTLRLLRNASKAK